MVILYGTRFYGKIYIVPGLFYVATKFFYLYYIPLIPFGSVIVFENSGHSTGSSGRSYLVKAISFSWQSLLMAYARVLLWVLFMAAAMMLATYTLYGLAAQGIIASTMGKSANTEFLMASAAATALSGALLFWSYRGAVASEERALELGRLAGFPDETILRHRAIDGYPLRSSGPQFLIRKCKACGAINRTMASQNGEAIACGHCGAVIVPKQMGLAGYLGFLAGAAAVALGVVYYLKHF